MSTVYLGIGSNVDTEKNIRAGLGDLRRQFGTLQLSPVYRSRAVGFEGNDFLNLVARVDTELQPLQLKRWLNELENRYGRVRDVAKFSDRTLDVDILLYDDLYLHLPELSLPRAEILHFAHVLKPLADLAPTLQHPVKHKTIAELWAAFPGDRNVLQPFDLKLHAQLASQ